MEEFLAWKEMEKAQSLSYYSKQTSKKKYPNASYLYFHCQRDGHSYTHRRKGEKKRKTTRRQKKGLVKTDMFCESRMLCKIDPAGAINVIYIKNHSHTIEFEDTEHQPIPKSIIENIKSN